MKMRFVTAMAFVMLTAPSRAELAAPTERPRPALTLSATLANAAQPLRSNLHWRIYNEAAEADGSHALVAETRDAAPRILLGDGQYIVHVAYGLAAATKRVSLAGANAAERLTLNAGGLKIIGVLGDAPIPAAKLNVAIYVPERGNSEAKLVLEHGKPGDIVALPEGNYHIVSTYLDTVGVGALPAKGASNATNSVVAADLAVEAGKLTEATLRHRAATLTLKLVNAPGGEALANTSFTVLTPGGDVIRELIGAFPSLILAEGAYVVIARHDGKAIQQDFNVDSNQDRDVEILPK